MPFTGRPHLGREAELEHVQRKLDRTRSGDGGFVVVRGPMGTGATRFAHEVAARADRDGMLVLWGRCSEGLSARPYSGLTEALEEYGTGLEPDVLEDQLGAGAPPLARLAPALRTVLPRIAPPTPLDAADDRLRLEMALIGWLERASAVRPLLLVLDDIQWVDPDLASVLGRLARHATGGRILVLATESQPPDSPGLQPVADSTAPRAGFGLESAGGAADVVDLPGLDVAAIAALLAQELAYPLPRAVVESLAEASAGIPLQARHLLRHVVEEQRAARAAGGPSERPLPRSFAELTARRSSNFSAHSRVVLNALACFPHGASPAVLATVCRLSRSRVDEALEEAVANGMARPGDGGQAFAVEHDLIRLTLLQALTPAQRADIHGRAAETLEGDYGDRSREHAGELGDHHHRSVTLDDTGRGIRHCLIAAEQARAAAAYRRSTMALGMALDMAPPTEPGTKVALLARLAVARAEAGLEDAAIASASEALEAAQRAPTAVSEALAGVIDCLRIVRWLPEAGASPTTTAAEELRQRAVTQAGRADELSRLRLEALGERWQPTADGPLHWLRWSEVTPDVVRRLLDGGSDVDAALVVTMPRARSRDDTLRALSVARTSRRPATVLPALRAAVFDMVTRHGLFREGAAWAGQYLAAAERYGSLRDQATALIWMARCYATLGRLEQAGQVIAAAREIIERIEGVPGTDREADVDRASYLRRECLLTELVMAHYIDGDWAALAARTEAGGSVDAPLPHAAVLAAEGLLAQARAGLEAEALAALPNVVEALAGERPLSFYRDTALLAALAGAWELAAAEHAVAGRSLIELARAGGAGTQPSGSLGLAQARMLALAGDLDAAREQFGRERSALEEAGLQPLAAILDHDEGIALAAAGRARFSEATGLLESAATRFEELGMEGWLSRVHELLRQGLDAAGKPGGRLHFRYPAGLSRREAEVIRLLAAGSSPADAANGLGIDEAAVERHVASALTKLGGESVSDVPRLARRHGLGGGV
jgi:DNA-binding CsgD family transcriptional regulator